MIASELKELRQSTDLSMADVSRLFKVPYRTWQNWENGERRVPPMAGEILKLYKEKCDG
jgi:DNA-binding transcriptional regulator YiaG